MTQPQEAAPPRSQQETLLAERLAAGARTALQQRRPAEALPSLDRLRLLAGHAGKAQALRAEALLALGRADEAEEAAAAARAEAPQDAARLELHARAQLACGRTLQAMDSAAAAVMAAPEDKAALLLFGMLLLTEHRHDEAIQLLGTVWRRWPDDPQVQLRLGLAFIRSGRGDAAKELLDHCASHAPGLRGLAALRAQAALARSDTAEAIAIAREGLDRNGPDAGLHSVLAHALEAAGQREEAAAAFRAAARLAPEDPYLAHLAATFEGRTTERATEGYVRSVFDGYAPSFESALIALGYRVPGLIRRAVERHLPEVATGAARLGPVLDLGCGTGLVGVALHDLLGAGLEGVDLSAGMLAEAHAKGIYTALHQADLTAMLASGAADTALIAAGDVFCYLGELAPVLTQCRARLTPGGLLIFSVERGAAGSGFRLQRQGRYAHAPELVRAGLATAGLRLLEMREESLRLESRRPVDGLLVVATPEV